MISKLIKDEFDKNVEVFLKEYKVANFFEKINPMLKIILEILLFLAVLESLRDLIMTDFKLSFHLSCMIILCLIIVIVGCINDRFLEDIEKDKLELKELYFQNNKKYYLDKLKDVKEISPDITYNDFYNFLELNSNDKTLEEILYENIVEDEDYIVEQGLLLSQSARNKLLEDTKLFLKDKINPNNDFKIEEYDLLYKDILILEDVDSYEIEFETL